MDFDGTPGDSGNAFRIELVLSRVDSLVQALRGVIIEHGHGLLADNRAGIDSGIHEVNGAAGDFNAGIKRLFPGFESGKSGKQRRMNVNDSAFKCFQEIAFQHPHESGQGNQIYPGILQGRDIGVFRVLVELGAEFTGWHEPRVQVSLPRSAQNTGIGYIAENNCD